MKKFIILALSLITFAGCSVGSHSVSSGKADAASISFSAAKEMPLQVSIDGQAQAVKSISSNAFKKKKDFKKTTENTLSITPGKHEVKVLDATGKEIFSKQLFISNQEHRVIEL